MISRLQHFRAAFLLAISSTLIYWVISYWLPLPSYLGAIANSKYDAFRPLMQVMIVTYIGFAVLNLVLIGLLISKISSSLKFWLTLVPGVLLLAIPLVLVAIVSVKYPDRNYFEVLQAFFRLFRFTKPDTFALAVIFTILAFGINVFAAVIIRRNPVVESVPEKLRNRYLIYAAIFTVLTIIVVAVFSVNSVNRALDRKACYDYRELPLPEADDELPAFLNSLTLYGQQAGTKELATAFELFATTSRQYNQLLQTDNVDDATLNQYSVLVASAKTGLEEMCSEFATD